MRRVVLACKTIEAELRPLLPDGTAVHIIEQGLHRTPDRLRERLQQEIDALDADEIVLGYGLCGKGIDGLVSSSARLVIPRIDDCISILLGSAERYRDEFEKAPGTYWLSHGWIEHAEADPYREYQRSLEKYGEETARWIASEMMKGYTRVALIDTGAGDMDRLRAYTREFASFFELEYVEMAGSDSLARAMASMDGREEEFVVVQPGERVSLDMFLTPLGIANG